MNDFGNILAHQLGVIEKEVNEKAKKAQMETAPPPDALIEALVTKWGEFVKYVVHQGGARKEDELRNISLYDFMTWLKG